MASIGSRGNVSLASEDLNPKDILHIYLSALDGDDSVLLEELIQAAASEFLAERRYR